MFICEIGCLFGIFLNSANLICRSTDISQCFRGPLRLRDNESQLYMLQSDVLYESHKSHLREIMLTIVFVVCICCKVRFCNGSKLTTVDSCYLKVEGTL